MATEQAVIAHLQLSDSSFGSRAERDAFFALEEHISAAIEDAIAGEFDGDLFGQGECVLYM